ncbi:MAG: hypothetical protein ABEI80_09565 [Haloplanus sp.]
MGSESKSLSGGGADLERSLILGDPRQRRLLSILLDRGRPIPAHELSGQLAARETDTPRSDVTEADHRPIRADLRHRCLPQLEAVGWIERRPEGIVVDEPISVETGNLTLPGLRAPEHPTWDAVSVLLERLYRQDIVVIVADRRRVTVAELVSALRARERASAGPLPDDDRTLRVALHHVDLPKLADVGLLEYDPDEKTAAGTDRLRPFADRVDLDIE